MPCNKVFLQYNRISLTAVSVFTSVWASIIGNQSCLQTIFDMSPVIQQNLALSWLTRFLFENQNKRFSLLEFLALKSAVAAGQKADIGEQQSSPISAAAFKHISHFPFSLTKPLFYFVTNTLFFTLMQCCKVEVVWKLLIAYFAKLTTTKRLIASFDTYQGSF